MQRMIYRRRNPLLRVIAVVMLFVSAAATDCLMADETIPLEVTTRAELRIAERDGNTLTYRYVPAQRFVQGQELFYTVRIRNSGSSALQDAIVVQPIPVHTHYLTRTATGAGAVITFSVDGGRTFAASDELKLPIEPFATNAAASSRRASAADYTHIRWQLQHPLEPGAVVLARFRVVFN